MKKDKSMKRSAKLSQLGELSKEMRKMMGDNFGKSLKKVTVAADSEEGLKKGLSKAQEIMAKKKMMPEMMPEMEDESEEMEECEACEGEGCEECEESEEYEDSEEMSPEAIKQKIKELQSKLSKME
jgi:hypothetical protein